MDLGEITETFNFLDDWEDRYRFIIDLGKELPALSDEDKIDEHLVRGCQSQVWLVVESSSDGRLILHMDSDAHIVRGLIAIVLAALSHHTPQQILATDMDLLFSKFELLEHLSPTRGNGLMAMLERIRLIACEHTQ